jgi:hypothetical protein
MNEKQYDWSFGFQYLIACAVGVALLGMVAFFAMWSIGEAVEGFAGETVALIVAGSLFGALNALGASIGTGMLLRSQGVEPGKWIGYSVVAGGIGGALGFGLVTTFSNLETVPESLAGLMMGLTVGLPLGIGQWLALRQAGVGASIWPLITAIAFILSFSAGFALGGEGREWIALGGMGLICGAITALGMVWLLGGKQAAVAA